MKISYLWIKDFVDFKGSPEDLSKIFLDMLGFDTAAILRFNTTIENVVTAKVEEKGKHPNADKLSLCQVFDGATRFRVVCGAPNVAAGQTVALARVGAKLPNGINITQAKIRGEESNGMICSARELGLGEDHTGIMVLPSDTALGQDIRDVLAMNDAILDLEVTPHRPDALSHWGLAREVSAATGKKLRMPAVKLPAAKRRADLVKIEAPDLCPRYIGRVIEGVAVAPSPLWMKLRLERCGIRSINNVVDITNYVLLELGHPLHAFDRDRLAEGRVVARRGRPGEKMAGLDGVTRPVEDALVIADAQSPAALAGVMGGEASGVKDATKNLLLESAVFAPSTVRRSRTRLNVATESSFRFERGTDPAIAGLASQRAADLILSLAGGRLTAEQDAWARKLKPASLRVQPARVNSLLGTALPVPEMKKQLERLGIKTAGTSGVLALTPPVHRHDLRETADIAEEILRLAGYDKVPSRYRPAAEPAGGENALQRLTRSARSFYTANGFFEAKNYGLVSRQAWEKLAGAAAVTPVELDNPLSLSGEILAPSLLVNLLENLKTNLRRGGRNVRLFETATAFRRDGKTVRETRSLSWVAQGETSNGHWKFKPRALEFWDAKSWVKNLLTDWRLAGLRFEPAGAPSLLHPAESLTLRVGEKSVGFFGRIHPARAEALDAPVDTFLAEMDLSSIAGERFLEPAFTGLPTYPAVFRDFSLIFPEKASWLAVALHLRRQFDWVENVELFDVFTGGGLPAGHRSLAFRLTLRHPDRTLADADVNDITAKILESLKTTFGATLRG